MNGNSSSLVDCEGWWDQDAYGRQWMEPLQLSFDQGRIEGSGADIIGAFTFSGRMADDGRVAMQKQYVGQHSVDYYGTYDGEGVMSGEWRISFSRGPWMIRIRRLGVDAATEIKEFVPTEE